MRSYFVVTGIGRSGSTMLVHLLDSHPDIECKGEEISPFGINSKFPDLPYRTLIEDRLFSGNASVCGFKMPWDWTLQYPEVWATFKELRPKFILADRENKLDVFVSSKLAALNSDWSSRNAYAKTLIRVSENELWAALHYYEYMTHANRRMAEATGSDVFVALYSQPLVPGHQKQILDFLGVRFAPLSTPTIRARQQPLSDIIENYTELKHAFVKTRFGHYFT